MQKDFTQTTDAEAIELLNEEVHSLRNNLDEMKEHFIANKEYIRYLEEELRKKNQCLADDGILLAGCHLRYTLRFSMP